MDINQYIEVIIKADDINVHPENIARLLDYELKSDEHLDDTIHLMIDKCRSIVHPKGGFIIKPIDNLDAKVGVLQMNGHLFNIGKIIASQLKEAQYIAIFFATIGVEVEHLSKNMMNQGNLFEGYTLDLYGSEAAESVAESVHQYIRNQSESAGFNITNRFSPGYCNWSVEEQFQLFQSFGTSNKIITLNDSALMNPIKSVSGFIGIGKAVSFKPYTCSKCSDKNCIYRNKRKTKE